MNNTKFLTAALCITAGSLFTACQHDELEKTPAGNENLRTYHITVEAAAAPTVAGSTKALGISSDNPRGLTSTWLDGDKMIAFVLADSTGSTQADYSMIESLGAGKGAFFKGEIKPRSGSLKTSNDLCFFYPGVASTGSSRTITPVTRTKVSNTDYYHDASDNITNRVELNMTRQDGTAETIGRRFDYQWKKVRPSSIQGTNVNVSIGSMERIISIWGLRFTDNNNQILTHIDSVYISNVKGSDVFNLGTGKFEEHNLTDESMNIVINPAAGTKISSAGGKYTYVAMLPGTYKNVLVMAYVGNTCYKKEFASLTFDVNRVHHSDLLEMQEVEREPYVEVQGVKWATGNFIHYGPENGGYWGIAPAQWWISRRAVMLDNNRTEVSSGGILQSSQFESSPTQTANDLDLFRYGDISEASNLGCGQYSDKDISTKKFYAWKGIIIKEVDRSQAQFGDIVWYHTMNNNQKYRIPNYTEMKTLYDQADAIPAYCYTDKGTVVYGGYFTTSGSIRVKGFPTKVRAYYKYTNVTALVRANKGLFLPITGRRMVHQSDIGYRDMGYGLGAYGQYMVLTNRLGTSDDFFFGANTWILGGLNGKGQARAIRPVWDETSTSAKDPVYTDFQNIK